ncbi:uncharacterized protein BO97DRAFT_122006 [Aspergillus homomorphus CBS 101889]|uniref:Uncharacterized protein n=1 Tax=Aspergillus homomorphus (strain CBS 101889) TaxID=1450537 RepID=A0A395HUN6_ASPHC|nr:hypothetical protein BO97DRAFT_122006 [Aspergillus homomorphus CBS 101889]RAL10548.1 hypothetical protein BO97DRAFT_122006 [Aspergillus homomorphus CBS 101889]
MGKKNPFWERSVSPLSGMTFVCNMCVCLILTWGGLSLQWPIPPRSHLYLSSTQNDVGIANRTRGPSVLLFALGCKFMPGISESTDRPSHGKPFATKRCPAQRSAECSTTVRSRIGFDRHLSKVSMSHKHSLDLNEPWRRRTPMFGHFPGSVPRQ